MSGRVAVAVVSWNTRELLRTCLRSLEPDASEKTADVWVVDNASTDGSAAMVASEFPWVELVASDRNLGFGAAVNLVAERTHGDWIAPANADIAVEPGALEALIAAGERHPAAGIVAPRLVMRNGATQHSVHAFPTTLNFLLLHFGAVDLSRRLADELCAVGHWNPERARPVDWAHGAFLLVRRKAFSAVGGFDPAHWMYAEDLDLAWRLRRCGWHTRYEPRAVVHHAVAAAADQAFGSGRAARTSAEAYAWMARRRGVLVTWAAASVASAGAAARWAAHCVAAACGRKRSLAERERWLWHLRLHRLGLRPPSRLRRGAG